MQILTVSEKVKKIIKRNYKIQIPIFKGKKIEETKYQISNKKLKKFLNINFLYNLDKVIVNIIKFLKKNEKRLS